MIPGIALILMCIVVFLAVPLEIAFVIQHDESSRRDITLVWLFGLIRIPLRDRPSTKPRRQSVRKSIPKSKRSRQRSALSLVQNVYFRKRFLKYARKLFRSIKVKTLDVQVRLGLDDPADTGRLWGLLGPLSSLFARCRKANIRIEPDFAAEGFTLQSHGRIRVIPLEIVMICLHFVSSPRVIHAIASRR